MKSSKQVNIKKYYKKRSKSGGEVIGSGGYGCVFKPALRCKDSTFRSSGISKLLKYKDAEDEWKEINNVKNIIIKIANYEKYFLLDNIEKCIPNTLTYDDVININQCENLLNNINIDTINSNLENLQIINMPFGGDDLDKVIKGGTIKLENINNILINLLKNAIIPMNKLGLYHCDLKSNNMLYYNNQIKIIDWGLSGLIYSNETIPDSFKNYKIQFNTPFSRILFNSYFDKFFNEYFSTRPDLHEKNKNIDSELKIFLLSYYNNWVKVSGGSGHEQYINEYILPEFYLLSNNIYPKTENLTAILFSTYCSKILLKYTDFNRKIFKKELYFNEVYIKNIDIWGFISTYLSFIRSNKYSLNERKKLANIIMKYCYLDNYSDKPINVNELIKDLKNVSYKVSVKREKKLTKERKTRKSKIKKTRKSKIKKTRKSKIKKKRL